MKTYIEYKSVNYNINEKKRTIVCVMLVCIGGQLHKVIGISKCSPDDTFDKKIGQRMAESRAKSTVYSIASNFYKARVGALKKIAEKYGELSNFCKVLQDKEKQHIKDLCD